MLFHRKYFQGSTWIGLILPESENTLGCDMCDDCFRSENKSRSSYCILCHHCRAKCQWVDGSQITHSNWNKKQPNGVGRCGFGNAHGWYSQPCTANLQFCCKRGKITKCLIVVLKTMSVLENPYFLVFLLSKCITILKYIKFDIQNHANCQPCLRIYRAYFREQNNCEQNISFCIIVEVM